MDEQIVKFAKNSLWFLAFPPRSRKLFSDPFPFLLQMTEVHEVSYEEKKNIEQGNQSHVVCLQTTFTLQKSVK